jgi:hypothetical protein
MAINKESVALNVINESLKLPFSKVDRSDFLTKTFSNKIDDMPKLLREGPQAFFQKKNLIVLLATLSNQMYCNLHQYHLPVAYQVA